MQALAAPSTVAALSFTSSCQNATQISRCCIRPLLSAKRIRFGVSVRAQQEQDYVVYDDKKSVFPAEACEELGGDSCEAEGVGPEVKGQASASKQPSKSSLGGQDREYLEYKDSKTVFPGEACDELGGEFCEPEYQAGVFPEKAAAK